MELQTSPYNASDEAMLRDSGNMTHAYSTDKTSTSDLIQDVLYIIVTPIICIVGLIGNIFSLVVLIRIRTRTLSKNEGRESTALLGMVLLALSDMCFCTVMLPRALVTVTANASLFDRHGFALYYQVYGTGFVTTFILTSTWITVLLSLFRYIGICHPLQDRYLVTRLGSRLTYFVTILLCVALNLPSFWQYRVSHYEVKGQRLSLIELGVFNLSKPAGIAFLWVRNILGLAVPTVVLSFCNWSLIRALGESRRMHRQSRVSETRSRSSTRTTVTLVVIVIVFVLLVFPCEVMDFLHDIVSIERQQVECFLVVRAFANILQVINFASNFILYCTIRSQFRDVLYEIVFGICRDKIGSGEISLLNPNYTNNGCSPYTQSLLPLTQTTVTHTSSLSRRYNPSTKVVIAAVVD